MVEGEEREQPRNSAIAVAKRVDTEEVEYERGDGDERGNPFLAEHVAVGETELIDGSGRVSDGNRAESDDRRCPLTKLNDLVFDPLPLSGIACPVLGDAVEPLEHIWRQGKLVRTGMDEVQSLTVPVDFLFWPVLGPCPTDNKRAEPRGSHCDPLDPVRGLNAMDQRSLAQRLQKLGRLPGVQVLPTLGLGDVRQKPNGLGRISPAGADEGIVRIAGPDRLRG